VTYVDPAPVSGELWTINRAELAAMSVALDSNRDSEVVKVLTDSQVVLHWIRNEIHRPMKMVASIHGELVEEVVNLIIARDRAGRTTYIGKVKAHAGVRGNDMADAAAKLQASEASGVEVEVPRHLRPRLLHMEDGRVKVAVGQEVPTDGPYVIEDTQVSGGPGRVTLTKAVANMEERLRRWGSNTTTNHYRMVQDMNDPAERRLKQASSGYMRSSAFTHNARRIIKALQLGTFQTQKRDHMMRPKLFPSPDCILCGGGGGWARDEGRG